MRTIRVRIYTKGGNYEAREIKINVEELRKIIEENYINSGEELTSFYVMGLENWKE